MKLRRDRELEPDASSQRGCRAVLDVGLGYPNSQDFYRLAGPSFEPIGCPTTMAVALPKPQLGGFLLLKIRNVNKHEEQTFFHWFSAIAEVAQLDHVRVYIRKLGTAAKAVANRRKLAIEFTGSAFEPDAVTFFGPVRDGDDVEKALGKYYLHLKSQQAIVDYANSTGMEPQWVFETRKDQLADSRELSPGFKEDCPELVDEEGNIMYTDPSFVATFAEAMVERHAGMKQKGDIHDFTVKMRKRRVRLEKWAKHILKKKKVYYIELWRRHAAQARAANCVDDAATEATRLARDAEAAATAARRALDVGADATPGAALDGAVAPDADAARAALAGPAEEPAPEGTPVPRQSPAAAAALAGAAPLDVVETVEPVAPVAPGVTTPTSLLVDILGPAPPPPPREVLADAPAPPRKDVFSSPPAKRTRSKRNGDAQLATQPTQDDDDDAGARTAAMAPPRPTTNTQPAPGTGTPDDGAPAGADLALGEALDRAERRAADEKARADELAVRLAEAQALLAAADERAATIEATITDRLAEARLEFEATANERLRAIEQERVRDRDARLAAEEYAAAAEARAVCAEERITAANKRSVAARTHSRMNSDARLKAEARVRELEEKLKDRADRARGDDTE